MHGILLLIELVFFSCSPFIVEEAHRYEWLCADPKLIILDEPTQGLAESEIEGFNAIINALRGQTTILLIEHNMNVVMALADAITVLDQGAVLATGAPEAIRADAAVQAAYLGSG